MMQEKCVEFWKVDKKESGSWAQMSENLPYMEPDPKDICRRYFPNHEAATEFAKSMHNQGYLTKMF